MLFFYACSTGFLGGLTWLYSKQDDSPLRRLYWPLLFYKLAAGVCMGLLYTYYYTEGDTFSFFGDATRLAGLARDNPAEYVRFLWNGGEEHPFWHVIDNRQSRSLFMVKGVSMVALVSGNNYWIATLYFSFFSFAGAWYLAKVTISQWRHTEGAALVAFLIYPSIVFWSSGIVKESLAVPCLFCMVAIFLKLWHRPRIRWVDWIVLLLCGWISWRLKYYYTSIFLSVACASLAVKYMNDILQIRRVKSRVLMWMLIFALFTTAATLLHPNFSLQVLPHVIADNYYAYEKADGAAIITFDDFRPTWASMLKHAPKALVSGLFRPFLWEADSWIMLGAALENTILLAFSLWAFVRRPRVFAVKEPLLILALVAFVVLLGILLPLSTPNFGTLSRYRIGYLAFFVFVLMLRNPMMRRKDIPLA